MKVLVIGYGLLGKEIVKQTGWDYISREKDDIDITNPETYVDLLEGYDTIVNCVAYTETYVEDQTKHWNVNYMGAAMLADICTNSNKKLIHISTDYLYANSKFGATENDVPVHLGNWYGYTKLLADGYVQLKCHDYLIVRCGHKPRPYPYKAATKVMVGNFDYADVIVDKIIKLIGDGAIGVYNVGTERKTMYDLASQTADVLPQYELPKEGMPSNVTMDITKLNKHLRDDE